MPAAPTRARAREPEESPPKRKSRPASARRSNRAQGCAEANRRFVRKQQTASPTGAQRSGAAARWRARKPPRPNPPAPRRRRAHAPAAISSESSKTHPPAEPPSPDRQPTGGRARGGHFVRKPPIAQAAGPTSPFWRPAGERARGGHFVRKPQAANRRRTEHPGTGGAAVASEHRRAFRPEAAKPTRPPSATLWTREPPASGRGRAFCPKAAKRVLSPGPTSWTGGPAVANEHRGGIPPGRRKTRPVAERYGQHRRPGAEGHFVRNQKNPAHRRAQLPGATTGRRPEARGRFVRKKRRALGHRVAPLGPATLLRAGAMGHFVRRRQNTARRGAPPRRTATAAPVPVGGSEEVAAERTAGETRRAPSRRRPAPP